MDEKELTTLLRLQDFKQSGRTWRCPDENQLAAYVNGEAQDRQKLERHLADCKHCLESASFLLKQFDGDESVPTAVLARARRLGDNGRANKWNWGWATVGATACLLIITSIILWQSWSAKTPKPAGDLLAQRNESPLPPAEPPAGNPSVVSPNVVKPKAKEVQTPIVRGTSAGPKLQLIFPREGSTVRLPVQTIRWLPIPDATFYEVKIVTEDGAAVATQSTNNTELPLPGDALKPGSKYFVTVVAHLNGNRTVRSQLVNFRIAR